MSSALRTPVMINVLAQLVFNIDSPDLYLIYITAQLGARGAAS